VEKQEMVLEKGKVERVGYEGGERAKETWGEEKTEGGPWMEWGQEWREKMEVMRVQEGKG
jgi:hypothetical protein